MKLSNYRDPCKALDAINLFCNHNLLIGSQQAKMQHGSADFKKWSFVQESDRRNQTLQTCVLWPFAEAGRLMCRTAEGSENPITRLQCISGKSLVVDSHRPSKVHLTAISRPWHNSGNINLHAMTAKYHSYSEISPHKTFSEKLNEHKRQVITFQDD